MCMQCDRITVCERDAGNSIFCSFFTTRGSESVRDAPRPTLTKYVALLVKVHEEINVWENKE
jgi:hypothetical protein